MIRPQFDLGSTSKTLNLSFLRFNERSRSENLGYRVHKIWKMSDETKNWEIKTHKPNTL